MSDWKSKTNERLGHTTPVCREYNELRGLFVWIRTPNPPSAAFLFEEKAYLTRHENINAWNEQTAEKSCLPLVVVAASLLSQQTSTYMRSTVCIILWIEVSAAMAGSLTHLKDDGEMCYIWLQSDQLEDHCSADAGGRPFNSPLTLLKVTVPACVSSPARFPDDFFLELSSFFPSFRLRL